MVSPISAVVERRHVLWTLVRRDLRVRYARSVLGYVWTILDPLMMTLIYFVVFTFIFKARRVADQPYFLYLISGMLSWQWFSGATSDTARALLKEAKLIRSTNLTRELWVIRVVIAKGIEYLLSLPILVVIFVFYVIRGESGLDYEVVFFPLGILLQFILLVGMGLILAPVTVLVTDLERVVRIFLRLLFYLTPVIYSLKSVPDRLRYVIEANPMTGILSLYRGGLFPSAISWKSVGVSATISVLLLVIGARVFTRLERAVLKEI